MVVSRDESVCAWERVKESTRRKRKKTKFVCASYILMIIYNMISMNQDKYFREFDIWIYVFLLFSLIEIIVYIRYRSIKLLASIHLNVISHRRDKLL